MTRLPGALALVLATVLASSTAAFAQDEPMPADEYRDGLVTFVEALAELDTESAAAGAMPTVDELRVHTESAVTLWENELARLVAITPMECYEDAHSDYPMLAWSTSEDYKERLLPAFEEAEELADVVPILSQVTSDLGTANRRFYVMTTDIDPESDITGSAFDFVFDYLAPFDDYNTCEGLATEESPE